MVKFEEVPSLFKFIEIENYLSNILGIKVDLVEKKSLKPRIGEHILKEVVILWEKLLKYSKILSKFENYNIKKNI